MNAAILILAAAVFYKTGHYEIGGIESAFHLLSPLFGVGVAAPLFAAALLAVTPALAAALYYGEAGTGKLLIFSQVILSIQLSFAVIPLVQITSAAKKMGAFVNAAWVRVVGWATAAIILGLNVYLVIKTL